MTDRKPIYSPADAPVSIVMNELINDCDTVCALGGFSRMDYCFALCNAAANIIALYPDMPRDLAMERIKDLHDVMVLTYDTWDVQGEG